MKKLLSLLIVCCSLMLLFGCSESPKITSPDTTGAIVTLVQRPDFIDTRPEAVIQQYILNANIDLSTVSKPPRPV